MKYSIITPVYNREDCISRCIESVIKQVEKYKTKVTIEHIIINDGSKDSTDIICKEYERKYNHIKYISFSKNKGTNAARNAGIKIATGTFCIILDSDDWFTENAISIIDKTISLHPEYKHYMFAPNDIDYSKSILSNYKEKELVYNDFLSGSINVGFIHCINTNILKKYPFDESVRIYEDVFFLSFYKEAKKMLFTNAVVTIRERNRNDRVSFNFIRTKDEFISRGIKAKEIILNRFGNDMKNSQCAKMLNDIYINLYDNYLLLEKYNSIISLNKLYNDKYREYIPTFSKLKILHIIYYFRLGLIYKYLLKIYLFFKYNLFRSRPK